MRETELSSDKVVAEFVGARFVQLQFTTDEDAAASKPVI